MYEYKNFLNMFSAPIQDELIRFCARITESEADTFVVMARKAVCLVQVMIQQGFIPQEIEKKSIISDRVFDLSGGDRKLGKVAIIDDVVISGSTIAKTITKIRDHGVRDEDIDIIVLAVNRETFNHDFFKMKNGNKTLLKKGTYAEIDTGDCLQLCTNISRSLSYIGHPYDIDYPHYADVHVDSRNTFNTLINPLMWKVYNNTNETQNNGGLMSLTVLPTGICKQKINEYLGAEFTKKIHFKLRMLIHQNGNEYSIKIVPMTLWHETTIDEIDFVFNAICSSFTKEKSWFCLPSAKLRLLQFVFAHKLIQFYFHELNIKIPELDISGINIIFGRERISFICDLLQQKMPDFQNSFISLYPDLMGFENKNISYTDNADDEYNINTELNEPFNLWYKNQEIPDREALKNIHYYDIKDRSQYSRLDKGFSINALIAWISKYEYKYQLEELVSCFIDRAIDYGTIVPIIYQKDNILCRAFRHGEDYEFTEDDRNKLQYFYKQFLNDVSGRNVTELEFYKIVSLFLQMGEKFGLVDKFYGFKNASQLLTIQYCIHGAVPVVIDSKITDDALHSYVQQDNYAVWLTKREFMDDNLIIFIQMKEGEDIKDHKRKCKLVKQSSELMKKVDFNTVSPTNKAQIDEIALLLSDLYNYFTKHNQKDMMQQYLVALTACMNAESFISAIIAEIRIGVLDWENKVSTIFKSGELKKIFRFANNLRTNKNDEIENSNSAFTAINSGRKKSKWYYGITGAKGSPNNIKNVPDIIEFFTNTLDKIGRSYKTMWRKYWAQYETMEASRARQNEDMNRCVGDVYLLNVVYRVFQYIVLKKELKECISSDIKNKQAKIDHIWDEITELCNEYKSYGFSYDPFSWLRKETPKTLEYPYINELMKMMCNKCQEMKERIKIIERYLSNKQDKFIRVYSSVIIIDTLLGIDLVKLFDGLKRAIDQNPKEYHSFDYRIISLENSERAYNRAFFLYDTSDARKTAILLWKLIVRIGDSLKYSTRCIIVPYLLSSHEYRYNVLGITQSGVDNFHNATIKFIEKEINLSHYFEGVLYLANKDEQKAVLENDLKETIKNTKPKYKMYSKSNSFIAMEDASRGYTPTMFCKPTMTLGIITVLECETAAIINVLGLSKQFDPTAQTSRLFYERVIEGEKCNTKIYCTQQLEPGGNSVIDAYNALKNTYKPDYFILCGVAGSVNKDKLGIGDVIIASSVLDGHAASEEDEGLKHESYMEKMHPRVVAILNSFFVDINDIDFTSVNNAPKSVYKCVRGPIADNGHVIKSVEAEFRLHASSMNRKVLAVETEGAGLLFAYRSEGLSLETSKGAIIVRGVSDAADIEKSPSDEWHGCASMHAAKIVSALIPTIEEFHFHS